MKRLSGPDANFLLDLIYECVSCETREGLVSLLKKLARLIPHEFNTCVFMRLIGNEPAYDVLNVNYPKEWLDLYIKDDFNKIDPIIKNNFERYDVQYWEETYRLQPPPRKFLELAHVFGLEKGYTHGARNKRGTEGSLFSFAGRTLEHDVRTEVVIRYVVPHLHQAFARIARPSRKNKEPLTRREREVLKWVAAGKSSWDISIILGISERTVNFHVENIMQKLDAVSRVHAVAVALELRLFDIG
ncbi:MAG TPA: LuxR C-terminal-related transcriptional regulator [Nitrospirota bacterium]|nr:LuxR C-terminal-related transcriptional regulator [Nitrospirota bacterium]